MIIETEFNKGQKVFFIENDDIISLPVNSIEYKNDTVTYSFVKSKALTSMDKDTIIYRDEDKCFASLELMFEHYENKA